jgi:hypothetical protein
MLWLTAPQEWAQAAQVIWDPADICSDRDNDGGNRAAGKKTMISKPA